MCISEAIRSGIRKCVSCDWIQLRCAMQGSMLVVEGELVASGVVEKREREK